MTNARYPFIGYNMPAANLIELYNFEGNVEAAFKSWLADNQIELYQTIEFDILPDDYIGAKLELGAVTGHYNPAPGGAAAPAAQTGISVSRTPSKSRTTPSVTTA